MHTFPGQEHQASKTLNDLPKDTDHCVSQWWGHQPAFFLLSILNNTTPTTYRTIHVTFPRVVFQKIKKLNDSKVYLSPWVTTPKGWITL